VLRLLDPPLSLLLGIALGGKTARSGLGKIHD
jgi:hypothetical protein